MVIRLTYLNARGKNVEKDFSDPMEIIGYIYRCWASARNAESTRRIQKMLDTRQAELLEEGEVQDGSK